ncbi:UNVERIFIED_ORG: hypothetical protein J2740_001713 [Rhizobium nepotum]|nr:hypothetical protein [Rhizobium nepotum]
MRKHWDRWFWAIATFIIAIIALRMFLGRSAFCGPETEQCFREWIAAVGGWVALGAAVPTVLYVARQVSDANRHQRENMQIQLRRTRMMAFRARQSAQNLREIAENIHRIWKDPKLEDFPAWPGEFYKKHFEVLENRIFDEIFTSFEDEIAVLTPDTIRTLRRAIAARKPDQDFETESALNFALMVIQMGWICEHIDGWMFKCINECDSYLTETKRLIDLDV